MNDPLVSVIMPCYNAGQFISQALESVGNQTYREWEVLAVDDAGSEDGTRRKVEAFAKRFPENRVEFIRHEANGGVSVARNTAIRNSRGKYLALLDPDDCWLPNHLQGAVSALEEDQEAGVCSAPSFLFSKNPSITEGGIEFYAEWEREIFPYSLGFRNALPTSASVIRRTALDATGLFDESPQLQHIEDYDMWLRLVNQGYRFILLREPGALYRKHAAGVTSNYPRMRRLQQALAMKQMPVLFTLQKVALEALLGQFCDLSQQVYSQDLQVQKQAARIQALEQTNQRIKAFPPIKMLASLRKWFFRR